MSSTKVPPTPPRWIENWLEVTGHHIFDFRSNPPRWIAAPADGEYAVDIAVGITPAQLAQLQQQCEAMRNS